MRFILFFAISKPLQFSFSVFLKRTQVNLYEKTDKENLPNTKS